MTVQLHPTRRNLPAYIPGRTVPGAIELASNETQSFTVPTVLVWVTGGLRGWRARARRGRR